MDRNTVFTKTAKGITQVNQKSASLSKDLMKVLKLIDGKSNFSQILEKADLDKPVLEKALTTLQKDGFARIFETRKEEVDPFAGEDDFDFTAPGKLPGQTQRVIAAAANDISELSRQNDARDSAKKAMAQAQDAARAKAKEQAETRARLEAEAKAKAEAEQRAMEQARKAKEASERAKAELEAKQREEAVRQAALAEQQRQEAAKAAALAAQQAKDAAERKLKEAEEAKRLAEMRARAEAEANARAKADLEAKAREEEKRQAEAQARLREEEQKAAAVAAKLAADSAAARLKQEEESRRLADLRVKAETEARALAEARAKAEAEAQALARARADAEAAAKKQAAEAGAAEKELKARLKDEIEARIRSEMEQLLRNEIEGKARAEMQQEIMAEAKLAAKAELEERLAEERANLQKAETEARVVAEKGHRDRADQEAKLRAEAEKRAAAESAAREKAEQENEALRKLAAKASEEAAAQAEAMRQQAVRAKEEAAAQAEAIRRKAAEEADGFRRAAETAAREKEEASKRLEAERRAKIEAEAKAMVEAEESERRERELGARIETEKRAREEAEMRAKIESRARETIAEDTRAQVHAELESDMEKRAEIEGKAQAQAYMKEKEKAEAAEDDRLRAEQARKAREIADILRTKVEPDNLEDVETPSAKRRRPRRRKGVVKNLLVGLVVLLVIAVGLLHVIPMRSFATKVEKAMSGWLHDDVAISSVKFWLVPTPHLKIEGLTVGKLLDAKAASGNIYLDVGGFFSDQIRISSLELDNVTLSGDAVRRIFKWAEVPGKKEAAEIESIRLKGVKLDVKPAIDPFTADLNFTREGALRNASIREAAGKWTLGLKPVDKGMDVDFYARYWQLPLGAPIPVSEVKLKGSLTGSELVVPEFEADTMEGKVNGTLRVNWASGIKLESDLSLAKVKADQLVSAITKDITVTGKLEGNFSVAAESGELATLLSAPRAQGKFRLTEGSISNVDLVAVMQSDAAGQRAGVSKFAELTSEVSSADHRTSFRNVVLQGGVLRGSGAIDIGQNSALSGRLLLEIRSQVAQDRGSFTVTGTVAKPSIRRGG